jgi:hemoglobin
MRVKTITEDSIRQQVNSFYDKVRKDALLGPIFQDAIGKEENWPPHLEKMYDFWSSIMLSSGRYHGNPFKKHLDLPPFDLALFDRWLALFAETAHELHISDIAERYIEKSELIAQSLRYGLSTLAAPSQTDVR